MDYMASCHGSYDLHYSLARILYTLLLHMHTSSNSLGLLTLFLLRNEKTLANLQSNQPTCSCTWNDLNFKCYSIISTIARGTNLIRSCKLCITIQPDILPGIRGLLESSEVIDCLNGAAVVLGVGIARLIHQGDNEQPTERPPQVNIFFSCWHHANEHTHVISIFTISTFWKDKDAIAVPTSTRLHHWTLNCLYVSIQSVLKVHGEVIYFPKNILLTRKGPDRI